MALLDTLRDRAARMGGTAQVNCGELGVLTVEALSTSDCARLSGDSRALLYAACRELQAAGEALRQEGKVFRPDEVTAYLTDAEADAAAQTILDLSGMSEIRLQSVQGLAEAFPEIRPESVQRETAVGATSPAGAEEIRLLSVQPANQLVAENGQVSREFLPAEDDFADESGTDKKSQILGDLSAEATQIVGTRSGKVSQGAYPAEIAAANLHETESELQRQGRVSLHEIESEFGRGRLKQLHETKSESGGRRGILLHETESESALVLHEMKSELEKALHEIKSEVREMLHENKSELAEQAAQHLAEALRRAGQVR